MTAVSRNLPDATAPHGGLRMRGKGSLLAAASTRCELALPTPTERPIAKVGRREAVIGGCSRGRLNQRSQPLHDLQRRHHQLPVPVSTRCLELELHLPGGVAMHPLVGQRWPGDAGCSPSSGQSRAT